MTYVHPVIASAARQGSVHDSSFKPGRASLAMTEGKSVARNAEGKNFVCNDAKKRGTLCAPLILSHQRLERAL